MSLKQLPEEILIEILLSFDNPNDLQNFVLLHTEIFNKIQNNSLFWKKVASLKFPNQYKFDQNQSWYDFYKFLLTYPIKNIIVLNFSGGVRGTKPHYYFYLPNGRRLEFGGSNPGPRSEVSLLNRANISSDQIIESYNEYINEEVNKARKWMNELLYHPIIQNLIINDIYESFGYLGMDFDDIELMSINELYDLLIKFHDKPYINKKHDYTEDIIELKRLMG